MNFINLIFGNPATNRRPDASGSKSHNNPRAADADDAALALAVSKALRQMAFIAKTYGFTLCDASLDDVSADLFTMLRYRDLTNIRFELIGHDGIVQFEFKLQFDADRIGVGRIIDSGNGIELPVLNRNLVAGRRMVIHRNGFESQYKDQLRLAWTSAENIQKSAGAEYESEHAARITGGRQAARFHVTDAVRHTFIVLRTGTKGFGFAKDLDTGNDRIYFRLEHWPGTLPTRYGTRFTGVLVQVPKGLQVRSIRPA